MTNRLLVQVSARNDLLDEPARFRLRNTYVWKISQRLQTDNLQEHTMNCCNDLERLLAARTFGIHAYPQVLRELRQSMLITLLRYHPELVGATFTIKNGDKLPKFVVWQSADQGRRIPIFTSGRTANEACKKIGARHQQFAFCEMRGKELFHLLACQPDPIVINPACSTNALYLDLRAVKQLADGAILTPDPGVTRSGTVELVDPADYPTDFIQPLFVFLRARSEVEAAWLFREVRPVDAPTGYVIVLKIVGEAGEVEKDFRIVASCACPQNIEHGIAVWDPNNADLIRLTSTATPFYAAPHYRASLPSGYDKPGGAFPSNGEVNDRI
jgi:hypothetical protein